MKKIKISISALFIMALLYSCSKDNSVVTKLGYSYFPVNVGHWVEYEVDSIVVDDFNQTIDTFQFFIREEIDSLFIDQSGEPTQRLERYKRQTSSDPWTIHKIWTSNRTNTTAQKTEDNFRFIKLVFPINLFDDWDGNAFNTNNEAEYEYTEVHNTFSLNGLNFDSVLTVTQVIDTNGLISNVIEIEKYAAQVGMIYKEQTDLEFNFSFPDSITGGIVYKERITAYGN
ncbi:MAG: hypothetical protein KJO64_07395 [Bacteroidia bacterium]|nr:hypothetical protein [Bacteroidia bacterium]NNC86152.1 hypothetical protein [Bacteroidia bacterium]